MEIQRDALSLERVVLKFPGIPYQLGRRERVWSPVKLISSGSPARGGPASGKETKQSRQRITQNGSWLQVSTHVTA